MGGSSSKSVVGAASSVSRSPLRDKENSVPLPRKSDGDVVSKSDALVSLDLSDENRSSSDCKTQ